MLFDLTPLSVVTTLGVT